MERLYIFPISVPLDMKPIGDRSAMYLAKTIARKANSDYGISIFEVDKYKEGYEYSCDIGSSSFTITIFFDKIQKNKALYKIKKADKKSRLYRPCFKQGEYYMICENPSFGKERYMNEAELSKKEIYSRFFGEDITFTENK